MLSKASRHADFDCILDSWNSSALLPESGQEPHSCDANFEPSPQYVAAVSSIDLPSLRSWSTERRFATFKVFYMDHVPDDYEPPHFSAGNPISKYFFTTHSTKEIPEKMSIGSLVTPYHGYYFSCRLPSSSERRNRLEMHIGSVSDVIPQIGDNDGARFDDLVNHEESSYLATHTMPLADRNKLIKIQQQDALVRKVVWDAEAFANPEHDRLDADGEVDPEYCGDRSHTPLSEQPIGIRRADGTVVEMSAIGDSENFELQVSYPGMKDYEPDNIKKIVMICSSSVYLLSVWFM